MSIHSVSSHVGPVSTQILYVASSGRATSLNEANFMSDLLNTKSVFFNMNGTSLGVNATLSHKVTDDNYLFAIVNETVDPNDLAEVVNLEIPIFIFTRKDLVADYMVADKPNQRSFPHQYPLEEAHPDISALAEVTGAEGIIYQSPDIGTSILAPPKQGSNGVIPFPGWQYNSLDSTLGPIVQKALDKN